MTASLALADDDDDVEWKGDGNGMERRETKTEIIVEFHLGCLHYNYVIDLILITPKQSDMTSYYKQEVRWLGAAEEYYS